MCTLHPQVFHLTKNIFRLNKSEMEANQDVDVTHVKANAEKPFSDDQFEQQVRIKGLCLALKWCASNDASFFVSGE